MVSIFLNFHFWFIQPLNFSPILSQKQKILRFALEKEISESWNFSHFGLILSFQIGQNTKVSKNGNFWMLRLF